jgi:trans-aconitate 2-methyltransferase
VTNITATQGDARRLPYGNAAFDAAYLVAVLGEIPDEDAALRELARALKPGGRLIAQCGGRGNLDRFWGIARDVAAEEPFAEHLAGRSSQSNFAGAEETETRLRAAGFTDVRTWLEPSPVTPQYPAEFIRAVNLRLYVAALPDELVDPYIQAVLDRAGEPLVLDYNRLNIDAA